VFAKIHLAMKKKETQVLNYRVIIEKEYYDDGTPVYVAQVPTLGIADDGLTIEEALKNIKAMIKFHVECLIEEGERVPVPDNTNDSILVTPQVEIVPSREFEFAFA
jgi:predicted RNase H-like HicB family nuclease